MDKAFHDAMTAGYALTEPGLVIGSPMLDGELANDARVQVALSMLNRHGLIAGATGTGKTKTLQLMAGQLSKAGVPVFVADIKGDLTGLAAPGDATNPKLVERVTSLGWTFEASGHPVEFLSLTGQLGRPGPGDGPFVRAAAARQGPRPQRDADLDPRARLQVLRRQRPAAARPQGPRGDAQVPRVRRGQADPGRLRRDVERVGRRPPALDRRPRAGGCGRLLRRARVRGRGPAPDDARGRGDHQHPRAVRRHGPAPPVLDVHALDARPAVRIAARGGRPAQAQAVLLLRRGAPAVRRRVRGADGPGRADGAADPLQGRRRLLRDPGADRRSVARSWPSSATGSSTRCGPSRPTTPTRCARPPGPSR